MSLSLGILTLSWPIWRSLAFSWSFFLFLSLPFSPSRSLCLPFSFYPSILVSLSLWVSLSPSLLVSLSLSLSGSFSHSLPRARWTRPCPCCRTKTRPMGPLMAMSWSNSRVGEVARPTSLSHSNPILWFNSSHLFSTGACEQMNPMIDDQLEEIDRYMSPPVLSWDVLSPP